MCFVECSEGQIVTSPWACGGCGTKMCRTRIIQRQQQFCPRVVHWQKALVFPIWMTSVSYLSVFQGVYPELFEPPTSQHMCILCHTSWCLNSRANYRSGNVGRTCNGSGNVWNSMHGHTGERLILFAVTITDIFVKVCYWILRRGDVIRSVYAETSKTSADELRKPAHQSFWFAGLRIRVSTFNYANAADHMTKSDLKRKSKMAAVIMKSFSQKILFYVGI